MRDRRPAHIGLFIDTSAHYALADPHDANHPRAVALSRRIVAARLRLLTTNFVLAETHALLLIRRGRATAWRVLQEIDRSHITIVRVSTEDEQQARTIIGHHQDKEYSLTDATSFAVMERLRMAFAFTFDHHFAQYGLTVLTPDNVDAMIAPYSDR